MRRPLSSSLGVAALPLSLLLQPLRPAAIVARKGDFHAGICNFFGAGRGFGWLWLNHRTGAFGRGGGRGDSRTNRIMGLCHLLC